MRAVIWLLAVVLVGCTSAPSLPPVTQPTNPSTSSTTLPRVEVAATYESVPCTSTPPVAFVVLCDSFDDLMEYYVDEPDPAALAAAAALGVAAAEVGTVDARDLSEFSCITPHESFEVMCDAITRKTIEGPVDLDVMVTAAVQGMFRYGLDPFSSYLPGDVMDERFDPTGLVIELGLVVNALDASDAACGPIGGNCRFRILSVFDFGAGDGAGLVEGDVLVMIDGEPVEGLSSAEATARLAGMPGTTVDVAVERDGAVLERSMTRDDVRRVPSEVDFLDSGIVYFRMNEFSQQAAIDLGAFLQLPEVEAASGLVLDLRDNPGGLVLAAQAVSSQFLADGLVLVERGRNFVESVPVIDGGLATDRLDLVVLVNQASASASEVVAAVLQERGRAVIIGETTFGKNLVQIYERARDGGQVGITIARWETPEGRSIGITGLEPDVIVTDDPDTETDEVIDLAVDLLGG